jgi:hypothetical protein
LTYIVRLRSADEQLLILKFLRNPQDFITNTAFFARFSRNPFGKILFFGKYFLIAEIYFGIFFLHSKFILGTWV